MLRAFGNDYEHRMKWLEAVQWHYDRDMLDQGYYTNREDGDAWRGCFIGCAWRSHFMSYGGLLPDECEKHGALAAALVVPEQLTRAWDTIFEILPPLAAREFVIPLSKSIRCGADLSDVWRKMCIWLLREEGVPDYAKGTFLERGHDLLLALLHRHGEEGKLGSKAFVCVYDLLGRSSWRSHIASSMHLASDANWVLRKFHANCKVDSYQLADKMLALLHAA